MYSTNHLPNYSLILWYLFNFPKEYKNNRFALIFRVYSQSPLAPSKLNWFLMGQRCVFAQHRYWRRLIWQLTSIAGRKTSKVRLANNSSNCHIHPNPCQRLGETAWREEQVELSCRADRILSWQARQTRARVVCISLADFPHRIALEIVLTVVVSGFPYPVLCSCAPSAPIFLLMRQIYLLMRQIDSRCGVACEFVNNLAFLHGMQTLLCALLSEFSDELWKQLVSHVGPLQRILMEINFFRSFACPVPTKTHLVALRS